MRRDVVVPAFFYPGGVGAVITAVKFELVDADHKRVVGFTTNGIVEPETVSVSGESVIVSLPVNSTLLPTGTLWKVTVTAGRKKYGPWYPSLSQGTDPISLQDLLLAEGLTEEEDSAVSGLQTIGLVERLSSGSFQTVELTEAGRAMLVAEDADAQLDLLGVTIPEAVYSHTLGTPSIASGVLTLDLEGKPFGYFKVALDEDVSSIQAVNLSADWLTQIYLEFRQATPTGTTYDVPVEAFADLSDDVTFDVTWSVYQSATPTIARLMTTDGGATWVATANSPA